MDKLAGDIARAIQEERTARADTRETEFYLMGMKRALVVAVGSEHARRVLAEYGETE